MTELSSHITPEQWRQLTGGGSVPQGGYVRERDMQETLRRLCVQHHWLYYHTHDSRRSPSGFLDTIAIKDDVLLAAELKTTDGIVTPAQQAWLEAFRRVRRLEVYLWRPENIAEGYARILRGTPHGG